jgi:hypothetical protein
MFFQLIVLIDMILTRSAANLPIQLSVGAEAENLRRMVSPAGLNQYNKIN